MVTYIYARFHHTSSNNRYCNFWYVPLDTLENSTTEILNSDPSFLGDFITTTHLLPKEDFMGIWFERVVILNTELNKEENGLWECI